MRTRSRFTPLTAAPRSFPVIGFDTEDDSAGNVKALCFHDGREAVHFSDPRRALLWLVTRRGWGRVVIAAVHLEYDLINLLRAGGLRFFDVGYAAGSGRIVWAKVRHTGIVLIDSLNLVMASAAKMGEAIGLPKLPFAPDDPRYVERDALIAQRFVERLQGELNGLGGQLRYTAGASALDLFRRRFMRAEIPVLPRDVIEFLRLANYGGRTEIFRTRARDLRYYDVNSLYPFVNASLDYPNPGTWRKGRDVEAPGVLDATVQVPAGVRFPLLPFRVKGKLCFPTGRFRGHWTTLELREAIRRDSARIERVHGGVIFQDTDRPFGEYVRALYPKRPRDGSARDHAFKLLLNSLWGKFGQGNETVKLVALAAAKGPVEGKRVLDGHVFETEIGDYPAHANQVWAAWTLAGARIRLREILDSVVDRGGIPCYCDTDSVIYSGGGALPETAGLGGLKLEGVYTEGEFLLPKVYTLKGPGGARYVAKGIPQGEAGSFIDSGLAEWIAPTRWRESGLQGANIWRPKRRQRVARYDKREVAPDGSTRPLEIGGLA